MAKLVDQERLARLAKALDARMKAAVKAEKERAMAAEQALQEAIDAINNGDNGILAEAKAYVDQEVKAEADRAKEVEEDHEGRIAANEAFVAAQPAKDQAQDERMDGLEGRIAANEAFVAAQPDVDKAQNERMDGLEDRIEANEAFVAAQPAKDQAQDERMDGLEGRIAANEAFVAAQPAIDEAQDDRLEALEEDVARLDGAVDVEGSVKKQIKDAIDVVNGAAEDLADRVEAVENFRDVTYPAAEAKVREDFAAADATNLQAAKDYADQKITALVNSAPEAMDTLKELADAIKGNEDIYKAYVEEHAQAMAQMKKDLQDEIDADVAAEAKLREEADAALQQAVDAKVAQADYDVKVKALDDEDARIAGLVKAEEDRAKGVEEDHEARIAANEAFVAAQPAVDKAQDDRLAALEAKFEGDESVAEQIADALQAAKDYADEKDAVVQGEVDALEAVVGKEAEGENAATGIFAKMAAMQADIDQNEADCDAAVKAENERAVAEEGKIREDFAAADEALHATVKAEMAAVIQSLVAEITEDGMLRIALGGVDGDDVLVIKEQEIPFVTDAEIDAMIAALDEEEPQA